MSPDLQLELEYAPSFQEAAWRKVLAHVRDLVARRGLKQVAFDLDMRPSDLANALAERNRTYLRAEHLVRLMVLEGGGELLDVIARLCGKEVVQARPPSPEEELAALKDVLEESLGPDIRRGLLGKVAERVHQRRSNGGTTK